MSRCGSGRNSPSASSSVKLGGRQLSFRCSGEPLNSVQFISDLQRYTSLVTYQSQFGKWVLHTISAPSFLNCYISAMLKTHINLPTRWITYTRCSSNNDWCTSLENMEETLSYLALQGWYDTDTAKVFNLLSAANEQQNPPWAYLWFLQHCHDEPCHCPVSWQVNHFRETHDRRVCRRVKFTLRGNAAEYFGFRKVQQLFLSQIQDVWGNKVCGLVLG